MPGNYYDECVIIFCIMVGKLPKNIVYGNGSSNEASLKRGRNGILTGKIAPNKTAPGGRRRSKTYGSELGFRKGQSSRAAHRPLAIGPAQSSRTTKARPAHTMAQLTMMITMILQALGCSSADKNLTNSNPASLQNNPGSNIQLTQNNQEDQKNSNLELSKKTELRREEFFRNDLDQLGEISNKLSAANVPMTDEQSELVQKVLEIYERLYERARCNSDAVIFGPNSHLDEKRVFADKQEVKLLLSDMLNNIHLTRKGKNDFTKVFSGRMLNFIEGYQFLQELIKPYDQFRTRGYDSYLRSEIAGIDISIADTIESLDNANLAMSDALKANKKEDLTKLEQKIDELDQVLVDEINNKLSQGLVSDSKDRAAQEERLKFRINALTDYYYRNQKLLLFASTMKELSSQFDTKKPKVIKQKAEITKKYIGLAQEDGFSTLYKGKSIFDMQLEELDAFIETLKERQSLIMDQRNARNSDLGKLFDMAKSDKPQGK